MGPAFLVRSEARGLAVENTAAAKASYLSSLRFSISLSHYEAPAGIPGTGGTDLRRTASAVVQSPKRVRGCCQEWPAGKRPRGQVTSSTPTQLEEADDESVGPLTRSVEPDGLKIEGIVRSCDTKLLAGNIGRYYARSGEKHSEGVNHE